MIITTTDEIQGFRIKRYLGVVRGIAEESTWSHRKESNQAMLDAETGQTMWDPKTGERVVDRRNQWEKAIDSLMRSAERMKANAVVGITYASYPKVSGDDLVTGTDVEILCYGTAVVIEPEGKTSSGS